MKYDLKDRIKENLEEIELAISWNLHSLEECYSPRGNAIFIAIAAVLFFVCWALGC